jgi:adenylate cyclase
MNTGRYTLAELAELAGMKLEEVRRYVDVGVLAPYPDETVPFTALNRLRLAHALIEGIPLEDLERAIASGALHFRFVDSLFANPVPLERGTYGEFVEELGITFEAFQQLYGPWELPPPERDQRIRKDDLQVLEALKLLSQQGADFTSLFGDARFLGENMRRLAEAQVRNFIAEFVDPLIAKGTPLLEVFESAAPIGGAIQPAVEEVVYWLHWRHYEAALVHATVQLVEALMEQAGFAPHRPVHPPAIAFLDVGGYVRLEENEADEVGADYAAELARIVWRARLHGGRAVKFLGEGVMFHFEEPGQAVRSALDILQHIEDASLPVARVGINAGPVVFRDGDYFGRTVNLASRIVSYARPREVLVSEDVVREAGDDSIEFEPIGDIALEGLLEPVPLYRARES